MIETLYEKVRDVTKVAKIAREIDRGSREHFRKPTEVPSYDEVTERQRQIILEYATNPILSEAISGGKSVEDSYVVIDRRKRENMGWRILPEQKDPCLDEQVLQINELISANYLKYRRLGFLTRLGLSIVSLPLLPIPDVYPPIVFGSLVEYRNNFGQKEAKYLDSKITKLFPF